MAMNLVIPPSVARTLHSAAEQENGIHAIWQIAPDCLLCFGQLTPPIGAADRLLCNGRTAQKPYLGMHLQEEGQRYTAFALQFDGQLKDIHTITIEKPSGIQQWAVQRDAAGNRCTALEMLSPVNRKRLLNLLLQLQKQAPVLAEKRDFLSALQELRQSLPAEGSINASYSLMRVSLLAECALQNSSMMVIHARLLSVTQESMHWQKVSLHFLSGSAGYVMLTEGDKLSENPLLVLEQQFIPLQNLSVAQPFPALLRRLHAMEEAAREKTVTVLTQYLLRGPGVRAGKALQDMFLALQHYLPHRPGGVTDVSLPFGMQLEQVVPLSPTTWVVLGWIRDALEQCETLVLRTEFGLEMPLGELHRCPRPDVEEHYKFSSYKEAKLPSGFAARVELRKEDAALLKDIAVPQNFCLVAQLKGGLVFQSRAARMQRTEAQWCEVLLEAARKTEFSTRADALLADAISTLRGTAEEGTQVAVAHVLSPAPRKPLLSLLLPLQEATEAVRALAARLGQDAMLRECEVMFVLMQPEALEKIYPALQELMKLYHLPARLLVTNRATDYNIAVRLAAQVAASPDLLLLQEGVIPAGRSGVSALYKKYRAGKARGPAAPRLMDAKGESRTPGRIFRKSFVPWRQESIWQPEAVRITDITALAAGCIMVARQDFLRAGKSAFRYIIPSMAAYELCLRLRAQKKIPRLLTGEAWLDLREEGASDTPAMRFDLRQLQRMERELRHATGKK